MGDKKYKDEHRRKGLCVNCSRPAVVGKVLCYVHLENEKVRDNKRNKKRKQKYKDENRCPSCSAPLSDLDLQDGYIVCCNCRQGLYKVPFFY